MDQFGKIMILIRCRNIFLKYMCTFNFVLKSYISIILAPENLALHKPTWQSSTLSSSTKSEKAVDGNTRSFLSDNTCAATRDNIQEQDAFWWVNLQRVSAIQTIVVYFRTENLTWGKYG